MTDLLLLGQIGGERVAFRAADIQSVVELDSITPVPMAPAWVIGLTALRSRPLTVVDSAVSLELDAANCDLAPASRKAVVVEQDRHLYALLVDRIDDVVAAESEPSPHPSRLASGWERCSIGLVETPVGPLLLVDPMAIIAGPDRAAAA